MKGLGSNPHAVENLLITLQLALLIQGSTSADSANSTSYTTVVFVEKIHL